MSRALVLSVLLAAWLATGIVAGIVMSYRRHDRFPWWLLGVAFGPLLVPLALGEERGEEPPVGLDHPKGRRTEPFRRLSPSTTRGKQPRR